MASFILLSIRVFAGVLSLFQRKSWGRRPIFPEEMKGS
jgi:hypothetical protein